MYRKIILGILTLLLALHGTVQPVSAATSGKKSVTGYSYTITPILAPFNDYFFVQTDNPDPTSFRFADKSSVYGEKSSISLDWDDWEEEINLYADVTYEDQKTGRVSGGYIFRGSDTDGARLSCNQKMIQAIAGMLPGVILR